MPTGYTASVHDGEVAFPDFVMGCARAFGALVMMRDDPADAEIPDEFEPSTHYSEALATAKARLDELVHLTPDDAERAARTAYDEAHARWLDSQRAALAVRLRYEAMLDQVRAWVPPSNEHQGLKDFMVSQLEDSIVFDCSPTDPPTVRAGVAWLADELDRARRDVTYYEGEARKEIERAEGRTRWVRQLRESLHAVEASA